jgi:hypothetical protein
MPPAEGYNRFANSVLGRLLGAPTVNVGDLSGGFGGFQVSDAEGNPQLTFAKGAGGESTKAQAFVAPKRRGRKERQGALSGIEAADLMDSLFDGFA